MALKFDTAATLGTLGERVKWRQDKSPHAEGSFDAVVLHSESQSETAGATRGGFAADPWTLVVDPAEAACAAIAPGDLIELESGLSLTVQQVTEDFCFGWTIRATAKARAPRT